MCPDSACDFGAMRVKLIYLQNKAIVSSRSCQLSIQLPTTVVTESDESAVSQ